MKKKPVILDPRRIFTPRQRADLFIRSDGKCDLCKTKIIAGEGWTAGHVIPHNLGGPTTLENAQVECNTCAKGTHKKDTGIAAKVKRQAGETGQQARRRKRGKGLIQGRGFSKSKFKRKIETGTVVPR